ncbi:MAG: quinolinate synthase NadA [Acidobacteria bacterium]|nr:quinolinate synthase NadA [Acidobacteriota bacterium]
MTIPARGSTVDVPAPAIDPGVGMEALYARLADVIPRAEWDLHLPVIAAISALKRERRAIILSHNYQTPEIFHTVSDLTGDSLALAREAAAVDADVIVVCGVHFMAETAKLLNPEKTVLIPDPEAGCSLASSITPEDVGRLRRQYPGAPVVTYVNTSAAVKAESDICCTSANAVEVVESLDADRVIFLPDEFLGKYVAARTDKELILWKGHCEVHEKFTAAELRRYRQQYPGVYILAHPECPPEVLAESDFTGSTADMIREVGRRRPEQVFLATEISMSRNLAAEFPEIRFIHPCYACPHMQRITLPGILECLRSMRHAVEVDPLVSERARRAVERMLELGPREKR